MILLFQIPSIANITDCHDSHWITADTTDVQYVAIYCAMILAFFGLLAIYPIITEKIKPGDDGRKPKLYFHFWAFHLSMIILAGFFLTDNTFVTPTKRLIAVFIVVYIALLVLMAVYLYFHVHELAIPFKCCRCKFCPSVVVLGSVCIFFPCITLFFYVSPTVVFIFYLYPIRTAIWLSFMINVVLYTNALIAALLFQCERAWYTVYRLFGGKIEDKFYEKYDVSGASNRERFSLCSKYLCQLIATAISLIMLLGFVLLLSGLISIDKHRFLDKSEVQTLF